MVIKPIYRRPCTPGTPGGCAAVLGVLTRVSVLGLLLRHTDTWLRLKYDMGHPAFLRSSIFILKLFMLNQDTLLALLLRHTQLRLNATLIVASTCVLLFLLCRSDMLN